MQGAGPEDAKVEKVVGEKVAESMDDEPEDDEKKQAPGMKKSLEMEI